MSGGASTSRGIVYQGIVCVLNSLVNEEWVKVVVEPKVEKKDSDKVDISWTLLDSKGNQSSKATQVKTTINQFTIGNIGSWLDELIEKTPNCDHYELSLIGNLAPSAYNLAHKINNQERFTESSEIKWSKLETYFGKISVVSYPINDDLFFRAIVTYLTELGEKHKLNLKFGDYSFASKALIGDVQVLSTKSVEVSREEYEKQIVHWLSNIRQEESKWKEAADKSYKHIVNRAYELCNLESWKEWYTPLIMQTFKIKPNQITNFHIFFDEIRSFNWPNYPYKNDYLEKSILRFKDSLEIIIEAFSNKCIYEPYSKMNVVPKHFYLPGVSQEEEEIRAKDYYNWIKEYQGLYIELSKSANLFADTVREKLDPTFLQFNGKLGGFTYSNDEINKIFNT
ncbi:hypothetical protein ABIC37_005062 [Priestia megaterium]|uniref:hypothetical protein n=1 Tax=Priestia megaterium TaxID=1404 RepID=UPI003396EC07